MARLRSNNVFGTITDNPLTNVATSLNSAGLANLIAVTGSDTAVITLDPNRVNGAPEIVYVTAHTASATSATILRGQEGTAARQHPSGTFWVHAPTTVDHRPYSPPTCRVFRTTAQSIPHNVETAIAFDSERFDTDTMHSTVSNTSRITIATAGVYLVTGTMEYASSVITGERRIILKVNGTLYIGFGQAPANTAVGSGLTIATIWKFAANDYVELYAHHTNGSSAAININANAAWSPEFAATWIGEG